MKTNPHREYIVSNVIASDRTNDHIAVRKSDEQFVACAFCTCLEFVGEGTFSFCKKLLKRVRGNNVCNEFEEKDDY